MIRVRDRETGEIRLMSQRDLTPGLASGRYEVSSDAVVPLIDAEGNRFEVDGANLIDALRDGRYAVEGDTQTRLLNREERNERLYGDAPVTTALEGVASGLTLGLGDPALAGLYSLVGDESYGEELEGIRQRRERNPTAATVGEVGGMVLPAFFTGGASLGARGGASALRAAARFTPGGFSAALGNTVGRGIAARGGGRLTQILGNMAADGAVSGVADAITSANLSDEPLTAERVMSGALFGAVTGGVGGAALHGAGRLARGVGEGFEALVRQGERLADVGLGARAETRLIRGGIEVPVNPREMGRVQGLASRTSGVDADDLSLVAGAPRRAFDAEGFERVTADAAESLSGLSSRVDDAAGAIATPTRARAVTDALASVDAAGARSAVRGALETVQTRLAEAGEVFEGASAGRMARLSGEVEAALRGLGEGASAADSMQALGRVIEGAQTAAREAASEGVEDGSRALLREVEAMVDNVASEPAAFGAAAAAYSDLRGLGGAWREARSAIELDAATLASELTSRGAPSGATVSRLSDAFETAEEVIERAERTGATKAQLRGAREALDRARTTVGQAIADGEVRGAALRGLASEKDHGALGQLATRGLGRAAGKLGGAAGAFLGGGAGYAMGHLAGGAMEAVVDAALKPVSTYQRVARLGTAARQTTERVRAATDRLRGVLRSGRYDRAGRVAVRSTSRVVAALRSDDGAERRAAYRDARDGIRGLVTDPSQLQSRLESTIGPVSEVSPGLSESMGATVVRGVTYLASSLPPVEGANTLYGAELEPSDFEVDAFLRRYEAIEDPVSVIELASVGELHPEHIEAVSTVYPALYADMTAEVAGLISEAREAGEPPPYDVQLTLGTLMGIPADASLTPEMIGALQAGYSQTSEQHDAIHGDGGTVARTGSLARVGAGLSQSYLTGTTNDMIRKV